MLRKITFIKRMAPTLAKIPPASPEWLHEVKFDGWRAQVHVEAGNATIYSRNGADITRRFRSLHGTLMGIPIDHGVIDCELVACDESGWPCFRSLMNLGNKASALCLWCFDLLHLDGLRLTPMPLVDRRALLHDVIKATKDRRLQYSGEFDDPLGLLAAGEKMALEGIVSKRRDSAYRLGTTRDWLKIKTVT